MNKSKKRGTFLATIFFTKNRRGSHIGVILSFVIFIVFIVFLYVVVQPSLNKGEDKKAFLEYLKMYLLENVSDNFTSSSVNIKTSTNKNCIKFKQLIGSEGLNIDEEIKSRLIIEDETEQVVPFRVSGKDLEINRADNTKLFFKIYNSPKFDKDKKSVSQTSCPSGGGKTSIWEDLDYPSGYSIGLTKTEEYVFEKGIEQLEDFYTAEDETGNSYYETKLKEQWKIPPGREFGFSFTNNAGDVISVGTGIVFTSVFAEEIPIQYIDKDAKILPGFINIRVW